MIQTSSSSVATEIIEHKSGITKRKKSVPLISVHVEWCKGCGICIAFCPKGILIDSGNLGKPHVVKMEDCVRCMLCTIRCPDFAIEIN
ncbi:MAG: 4Fe-4S dicluster domain-containing protein [bacterium]|nr:4Fe-4S dicluster domain-containing protein [bacterium]